jgi:adenylate cyclase
MLINFMGGKSSSNPAEYQTFPVRSYARFAGLAPGTSSESWANTNGFGGKVVMVGAFTLGMADDEKPTPMGLMFGVEIHANALNTIIMENFITKPASWMSNLVMLALILIFAFITSRMKGLGWSAGILVFFVIVSFLVVTILFDNQGLLIDWGTPIFAVITTFVAVVIYRVLTAERDKRQIKGVFGQFIAPELVEELAIAPPKLGGEYINGTVLFSDIRGFSYLSERLSAEELVDLLNEYLTLMTDNMVNEFGGTLDKYIGDAIMAFWGAPKPLEDHAVRACKSAVAQIRILNKYNPTFREKYQNKISIGIGINSGDTLSESLMVSYMGSEGRKNYTAMGDTVNLASRLEGVNKEYRTTILISEDTYDMIKDEKFIVRELDEIRVKGRNKPVTIYELVDYDGELAGVPKEEIVSGEQG